MAMLSPSRLLTTPHSFRIALAFQLFCMKNIALLLLLASLSFTSVAADGDTVRVTAHDARDITWYGSYDDWGVFPPAGQQFRKVLMHFTLGCASTGCSDWDYTVQIDLRHRTGALDSTVQQAPNFTVYGTVVDSISYTTQHTFLTEWNNGQIDTLWSDTLHIVVYNDSQDPFAPTDTLHVFPSDVIYDLFDENGTIIGQDTFVSEATLYLNYTDVYTVFEVIDDYELARAITPYGTYMADGSQGFNNNWKHTFSFDVTEYQHLLRDSVEFRAFYGGWSSGFSVTLDFEMIEGIPPMDVLRVSRIYDSGPGGFGYSSSANFESTQVPARTLSVLPATQGAIGRMFITGHGQDGEFTPNINYNLRINGLGAGQQEIWKDDCGMNAVYPQGGTWVYDRANWCPGEAVRIFDHDLTAQLNAGEDNTVDVNLTSYNPTNGANYIMELQVIEHSAPNFALDAEVMDIITPSTKDVHARFNPMCGNARIMVRNTGAATLTSATITYGIVGGPSQTYAWTGSLDFLKSTEVTLPTLTDWSGGGREFFATISAPNGGVDGHAANDTYTSTFEAPDVVTDTDAIIIWVKANNYGGHTKYWVYDDMGNEVFARTSLTNNELYKDTLYLPHGCYNFRLTDLQENGLQWWAASDQGNGYARIRKVGSSAIFKNFNADFGSEISYWFTMGAPLAVGSLPSTTTHFDIWPNPTTVGASVHVSLALAQQQDVQLAVYDVAGRNVWMQRFAATEELETDIALNGLGAGMYLMQLVTTDGTMTRRLVVQ